MRFSGRLPSRSGSHFRALSESGTGFLHRGFYLGIAVLADGYLFPCEFADIGVSEAAEAAEQECRFDVIVRLVLGLNYSLDFFEGQVAAGFLFGVWLQFPVYVFSGVL